MTLWAYRDTKTERLVRLLADTLGASWPADAMAPMTLAIGSRGMQRWLNYQLATRHGSTAGIDFLFPANAFSRAVDAVHDAAGTVSAIDDGSWSGLGLQRRVIAAIRARIDHPTFSPVRHYLDRCDGPVGARELTFTGQVTNVLERLLYDRPDDALAWMNDPSSETTHRWLALLLADLAQSRHAQRDPASRLASLQILSPQRLDTPLFVFGLPSLRNGDKRHIAELARHMDIHLFTLVPSSQWWADIRLRRDERTALKSAKTPQAYAELLDTFERNNRMLAVNGAPSRDLQLWLEDLPYQTLDEQLEEAPPSTRLQVLQQWIDDAAEAPELIDRFGKFGLIEADASALPSIEINACHGALRQCEALRDDLLRRFAADPTLEPRHVLVMTPDLATYAPLLAAILGREQRRPAAVPAIPVHIADLGLTDTNPVAAVLLDVIGLVEGRVTATRLLELLAREPVRTKFRLDDDDLRAVKDLVVASGLRWAWDANDRQRHDQPARDQNTIRFALERLALGVLMPDPGGLEVIPGHGSLGPAAPVDLPSRDQARRFGVLASVCDALQTLQQRLRTPATAAQWRERLGEVLTTLCAVPESKAWQLQRVSTTLHELLEASASDHDEVVSLTFDASSVAALLTEAFALPRGGDRPNTGAVTVCSMEPMRSVPFRIVVMIGMDDATFPRPARSAAWDPFATAKRQESDRRSLDRHLFLESLLCARDALLIYGRGFEASRGEAVPLAVVVEELVELLANACGLKVARDLLRTHPLQPWSAASFCENGERPHDAVWAKAALAHHGERQSVGLSATPLDAAWPTETEQPTTLTARTLASGLENAPRAFLEQTLGLSMRDWSAELVDREPIEIDSLDAWGLRDEVLRVLRVSPDEATLEQLLDRQRALGAIPLQAGGELVLRNGLAEAQAILARAQTIDGTPVPHAPYLHQAVTEAGQVLTLVAAVPEVRKAANAEHVHVWITASNAASDKLLLEAWFSMLIARAMGEPVHSMHIVSGTEAQLFIAPEADLAHDYLNKAVALWWRVRRQPVLLVPVFSKALAESLIENPSDAAANLVAMNSKKWFSAEGSPVAGRTEAALNDVAVRELFGAMTASALEARADECLRVAQVVWEPLLTAARSKRT